MTTMTDFNWNAKQTSHQNWWGIVKIAVIMTLGCASPAVSGGFINNIQSVTAASVSTAGASATAEDASTIYYNPAGMTLLDRPELLIASGIGFPSSEFKNGDTTNAAGLPVSGSTGVTDETFLVPSIFATMPISDSLHIGVGVFSPFGESQGYDNNWVGRYQSQSTSLKTIEFEPALAYRINDTVSLGAGLDIQYARFARENAIDFGSACFGILASASCFALGLLPSAADGELVAKADDWSVGYGLGALYHAGDSTHVGISFRSPVDHDLSGKANFEVPAAARALTAGGLLFQDTSVHTRVTFPGVLALGLSQKANDRLTLLVEVDRTFWSRIKELTLNFGNPNQSAQSSPLHWEDTSRVAVGGVYRVTHDTDVRAGFSYDESPVPGAFRNSDLPDSDQITFSTGLMHRFNEQISCAFSYSFTHFMDATVNLSMPAAGTLVGSYQRNVHALGLQTRVQF
jgi:long-chain fatty acid transport protein